MGGWQMAWRMYRGECLPVTLSKIRSTAHYRILIPTNFSLLNFVGLSFWTYPTNIVSDCIAPGSVVGKKSDMIDRSCMMPLFGQLSVHISYYFVIAFDCESVLDLYSTTNN